MKIKPTTVADNALDFLIAYAAENRGTIAALAERLIQRTGQQIYRQQVASWLAPDPARRTEPQLGIGLLLIHEGALLIYGMARWLNIADCCDPEAVRKKVTTKFAEKEK